jgi:hypothetical protein
MILTLKKIEHKGTDQKGISVNYHLLQKNSDNLAIENPKHKFPIVDIFYFDVYT